METLESSSTAVEAAPQETKEQIPRSYTVWHSRLRRGFVGVIILAGIVLTPFTTRWSEANPLLRDLAIFLGTLLICTGTALRLWAGLYIGGHKERRLVTDGPYSCVRNPLYLTSVRRNLHKDWQLIGRGNAKVEGGLFVLIGV